MIHDLSERALKAMKDAGVIATASRVQVWKTIAQADRPLRAVEIKRQLLQAGEDLPLSSIYSALNRFVSAKVFSTYTADGATHYSFSAENFSQCITCTETGKDHWVDDPELTRAIEAFCARHGFSLTDYNLSVRGRRAGRKAKRRPKA